MVLTEQEKKERKKIANKNYQEKLKEQRLMEKDSPVMEEIETTSKIFIVDPNDDSEPEIEIEKIHLQTEEDEETITIKKEVLDELIRNYQQQHIEEPFENAPQPPQQQPIQQASNNQDSFFFPIMQQTVATLITTGAPLLMMYMIGGNSQQEYTNNTTREENNTHQTSQTQSQPHMKNAKVRQMNFF